MVPSKEKGPSMSKSTAKAREETSFVMRRYLAQQPTHWHVVALTTIDATLDQAT